MQAALLSLAVPLLVGPITFALMQVLKTASDTVDKLSPTTKRFAVAGIAVGLTALGHVTGIAVHCDVAADVNCLPALDNDTVKAIVGAALAYGIHFIKPSADKADLPPKV